MATRNLAIVAEGDYPMLKKLIPSLPETFALWRNQQENSLTMAASGGTDGELKPVSPAVFHKWCIEKGDTPSEHILNNFVNT